MDTDQTTQNMIAIHSCTDHTDWFDHTVLHYLHSCGSLPYPSMEYPVLGKTTIVYWTPRVTSVQPIPIGFRSLKTVTWWGDNVENGKASLEMTQDWSYLEFLWISDSREISGKTFACDEDVQSCLGHWAFPWLFQWFACGCLFVGLAGLAEKHLRRSSTVRSWMTDSWLRILWHSLTMNPWYQFCQTCLQRLRSSGGVSRTALAIQIPSKRPLVAGFMSVFETRRGFTWIYDSSKIWVWFVAIYGS